MIPNTNYRIGQQLLKIKNKAGNYVNVHSIQELRKSEKDEVGKTHTPEL